MNNDSHARHLSAYVWLLVGLIIIAALGYIFRFGHLGVRPSLEAAPAEQAASEVPAVPAPTAQDLVTAQHGFQYLVQFSDGGFLPQSISVKKGETVRFTNNSARPVTITGSAGASDTLQRGQYWEFTAKETGTFGFSASGSSITISAK